MHAAQRFETALPPLAIDLAGEDLASSSTTWTALPDLGETTVSAGNPRRELDYMHARHTTSKASRFASVDPVGGTPGAPQTWNRYAYSLGSPLRYTDPTGARARRLSQAERDQMTRDEAPCESLVGCVVKFFRAALKADQGLSVCILPMSVVGGAVKVASAAAAAGRIEEALVSATSVATPYGAAIQSTSKAAIAAREAVAEGALLYRGGVLGKSAASEGQFWALQNPLNANYAARYGLPDANAAFDFVETGRIATGANFITREAPAIGTNLGGAVEVVTDAGAVRLNAFNPVP